MKSFSLGRPLFARLVGALCLLGCAAVPLQAMAQTPVEPAIQAPQKSQQSSFAQLQQQYMAVQRELMITKAKAEHNDPALLKENEAFRTQLFATMKKNGSDPAPMIASFKSMAKQLSNKSLPSTKRAQLLGQARQLQMSFFTAEHKAMQDPKLQAASKTLEQTTLAAMRKVNPKTDALVAEMHALQVKMIQARIAASHSAK